MVLLDMAKGQTKEGFKTLESSLGSSTLYGDMLRYTIIAVISMIEPIIFIR